jgi:hypothetical protein
MAARQRTPRAQLHDLADRVGVAVLAKRLGRRPQTVQRWLDKGAPASAHDTVREAYERSESARKGQATRRLAQTRQEGPKYDGRTAAGHAALKGMIESEEDVWINFLEAVKAEGRDQKEAFSRWYSPKLKSKTKRKKKKRRKRRKR